MFVHYQHHRRRHKPNTRRTQTLKFLLLLLLILKHANHRNRRFAETCGKMRNREYHYWVTLHDCSGGSQVTTTCHNVGCGNTFACEMMYSAPMHHDKCLDITLLHLYPITTALADIVNHLWMAWASCILMQSHPVSRSLTQPHTASPKASVITTTNTKACKPYKL